VTLLHTLCQLFGRSPAPSPSQPCPLDAAGIEQYVRDRDSDETFLWQRAEFGGRFYCPTNICVKRAQYALAKERDTIAWLDRMPTGALLWDIGANIGVYTIYAGLVRKAKVIAFEPGAANFAILNRNIFGNGLQECVAAYGICVGAKSEANRLFMQNIEAGGALHNFGAAVDYKGDQFDATFLQGSLSVSADALISEFGIEPPEYMKLDVDGLEQAILEGAKGVLGRKEFRSLLVEANLDDRQGVEAVEKITRTAGLFREQNARYNNPRSVEGVSIQNLIFSRIGG